jgi:hypothetical protein
MSWKRGKRLATLIKSSEKQQSEAFFAITQNGITDEEIAVK